MTLIIEDRLTRYEKIRNAIKWFLKNPRGFVGDTVDHFLNKNCNQILPKLWPSKFLSSGFHVQLTNFSYSSGNAHTYELLILASLVAKYQPKILLEIGTFDGNSTLQLALNAPKEASVHTLDIPQDSVPSLSILPTSMKVIESRKGVSIRFLGSEYEKKIKRHFGDSATYDFSKFGNPDFIFIDAGHSYEYIKNDTEKSLEILSEKGIIVWHDFQPPFQGVMKYLTELSQTHKLFHIPETTLVVYFAQNQMI